MSESVPFEGEMRKVKRESDKTCVVFEGFRLGSVKVVSFREDTIMNFWSGCWVLLAGLMLVWEG